MNVEIGNEAVSFLGIHKSDLLCSACPHPGLSLFFYCGSADCTNIFKFFGALSLFFIGRPLNRVYLMINIL
jgi:hypothetical protein